MFQMHQRPSLGRVSYKNTNNIQLYDLLPDDETVGFKDVGVPLLSYNYECVNDCVHFVG